MRKKWEMRGRFRSSTIRRYHGTDISISLGQIDLGALPVPVLSRTRTCLAYTHPIMENLCESTS